MDTITQPVSQLVAEALVGGRLCDRSIRQWPLADGEGRKTAQTRGKEDSAASDACLLPWPSVSGRRILFTFRNCLSEFCRGQGRFLRKSQLARGVGSIPAYLGGGVAKRLTTWARDRGVVGSNPDNIFSPVLGWWDKRQIPSDGVSRRADGRETESRAALSLRGRRREPSALCACAQFPSPRLRWAVVSVRWTGQ